MADTRGAIVVRDHRGQRRDPTAATVNTRFTGNGAPMLPEWDSAAAFRSAYYANVFVYRCVQVRARALAALPFRVGADPAKPKDFNAKAPLAQLLGPSPGGPNTTTTARRLWAWTLAQKIVAGRFGWEIETGRGDLPVGLWPLPTSQLKAIPSKAGARYFDGFKFGNGSSEKRLTTDQVVYAWNPSQEDWRQPESALQAARLDISIAVMQNRYDFAFLKNDARPAAIVVTKEFEDDDDYDRFKGQFQSEHGGPDNTGKIAFVEDTSDSENVLGAIDIKQLGLSQTDAQFIAREEAKIRAICIALGVPMSKLGDASRRTFSNAGQETLNFETDTVIPDAHDLEDEINLLLAPRFNDGLVGWFDLSSLTASQSRRFTPVALTDAYAAGLIDEDEARGELGYEPRADTAPATADDEIPGATLLQRAQAFAALAASLTPESAALLTGFDVTVIEAKTAPTAPAPPTAVPAASGDIPVPAQQGALTAADLAAFRAWVAPENREPTSDDRAATGEARRASMWADVDARATALEHIMAGRMRKLFDRQSSSTVTRLQNKRGRQMVRDLLATVETRAADDLPDAGDLFDSEFWQTETADQVTPVYESATAQGAQAVAGKFGIGFDIAAPSVEAFILARANQLAGTVTDTTYRQIQQALADGVTQGWGIDALADAIRGVFTAASSQRATVIARTEVLSAYNGAQDLQAALLPADVAAGKEWIATRDDRTRDAHASADGQTVATTDAFTVLDEELQYPGDPNGSAENVIQCRCTVGYLTPDEMPDTNPGRARRTAVDVEYRVATSLLRELVSA